MFVHQRSGKKRPAFHLSLRSFQWAMDAVSPVNDLGLPCMTFAKCIDSVYPLPLVRIRHYKIHATTLTSSVFLGFGTPLSEVRMSYMEAPMP